MLNAIIQNQEGGTLLWEFPGRLYKLWSELQAVGIERGPGRIPLIADEDSPISVKLYANDDVGNHLLRLFAEKDTLEDVSDLTAAIERANDLIREELIQRITADRYLSRKDLYQDIRQMNYDAGMLTETLYFPLVGNIYDSEYGEDIPAPKRFLCAYEEEIREKLLQYIDQDTKNMAEYYDGSGQEKVLLADWNVENIAGELFGRVDVRLTEPLTAEESECLQEWINGQNSDGLGEGFEQQEIETDEGTLYVSFWNSENYFLYDMGIGQQMGGQSM